MASKESHQKRAQRVRRQIKKVAGEGPPALRMVENPDILATIGHSPRRPSLVVGFAAETQNLVENARRYGGDGPIGVTVRREHDRAVLEVVDRGPGVPPEQRERMFEPFQRLDDTSPGGLGLGLAVARGLAEAVGGSLAAEETPVGGLTMVLALPRAVG